MAETKQWFSTRCGGCGKQYRWFSLLWWCGNPFVDLCGDCNKVYRRKKREEENAYLKQFDSRRKKA